MRFKVFSIELASSYKGFKFLIIQRHRMYFSSIFCNEKHQIRGIFNTFIENQKL